MNKIIEKLISDSKPELKGTAKQFVEATINFYEKKKKFARDCNENRMSEAEMEDLADEAIETICQTIPLSVDNSKETGKEFADGLKLLHEVLRTG